MEKELKLKPHDYIIRYFNEGTLRILGEEEEKIHRIKSRLEYGYTTDEPLVEFYPYLIFLEDLKKIKQYIFPLRFKKVDDYTMVRRTIKMGLQIMRAQSKHEKLKDVATFSRREWKTIEQYL